jgi:hypothetical protein
MSEDKKSSEDWLDEYFQDWNDLSSEEKSIWRKRHAVNSVEIFDRRNKGLLTMPNLNPKKKKSD